MVGYLAAPGEGTSPAADMDAIDAFFPQRRHSDPFAADKLCRNCAGVTSDARTKDERNYLAQITHDIRHEVSTISLLAGLMCKATADGREDPTRSLVSEIAWLD
jgi:hypothetical protein